MLINTVKELIDAAEPIAMQHDEEPDEYVVPAECIEDLRQALVEAEGSHE